MGGCLDREKDKQRILGQLSYKPLKPIQKDTSSEFFYHRHQLSQSTRSQHVEMYQPHFTANDLKQSYLSSRKGNQSCKSESISYDHIYQHNQFILIQRGELKQFLKTNPIGIDQIIVNPINPSQFIICFDQNDINDAQVSEWTTSGTSFHKLYMLIKDFIGQPDKKMVGIISDGKYQVTIFFKKLNTRQAVNNSIEMQLIDNSKQDQLEDIINERLQDNLICCNILELNSQSILFFQTCKRQITTLNVISLDMSQLNSINLSQEIAGKVEVLKSNDEFDFISLLPDLRNRSLYILMSIKQL